MSKVPPSSSGSVPGSPSGEQSPGASVKQQPPRGRLFGGTQISGTPLTRSETEKGDAQRVLSTTAVPSSGVPSSQVLELENLTVSPSSHPPPPNEGAPTDEAADSAASPVVSAKGKLSRNAGRYSMSSVPPPRRSLTPAPSEPQIPRAAMTPVEAMPGFPDDVPDSPRTERGLGVPSPPPPRTLLGVSHFGRTAAGLGPGVGARAGLPSHTSTLKGGQSPFFEDDEPSDPESWKPPLSSRPAPPAGAGVTKPITVSRVRGGVPAPERFAEELRVVRQELLLRSERRPRVVLLISPASAAELLAHAAVELATRLGPACAGGLIVVEADFERPRLGDVMRAEVPAGKGLSEQLHATVRGRDPGDWTVMDGRGGFHAVLEGRIRSPGLLLSQQFPEFIEALRRHYRIVLLAAPARPSPIDLQALGDVCDDVLLILDGRASQAPPATPAVLAEKVFRTVRLGGS